MIEINIAVALMTLIIGLSYIKDDLVELFGIITEREYITMEELLSPQRQSQA